ncbi:hypothetical protein BRC92_03095 [Halobacteriales archaeon QS_4_69_31]|nr:MAG: hypothetical protein BRC92_03095 [Halobacteriales archaeon QS_4_69_31]
MKVYPHVESTRALVGVGCGFVALVVINAAIAASGVAFAQLLGPLAVVVVLAVVFFPLFYLFPDRADPPLLAVPGTVVAAGGWTVLGTLFRAYAGTAGRADETGTTKGPPADTTGKERL